MTFHLWRVPMLHTKENNPITRSNTHPIMVIPPVILGPTSPNSSKRVICQYCEKLGHTTKNCFKLHGYPKRQQQLTAHHASSGSHHGKSNLIMDLGATHHITHGLDNLHLTTPYHGHDQLVVGDGNALPITRTSNYFTNNR